MLELLQHIDEHLMLLINISLSNPIFLENVPGIGDFENQLKPIS